ncbi:MAG: AAA family ATPase [Bdellovibrionales bacterium]|nr:AAA family ATPase [Bdellovibrionales bacterium]
MFLDHLKEVTHPKYEKDYEHIDRTQVRKLLEVLVTALYEHYKRDVVVLIDEYDAPFNTLFH